MNEREQEDLVLGLAIDYAKEYGDWPQLEPIHEHIHQVLHQHVDVKATARRLAPLGYIGGGYSTLRDAFAPPLDVIARHETGRRILECVVEFVKLACDKYERSEGQPELTSDEAETALQIDAGMARAVRLFARWVPFVTDGGHGDAQSWSVKVDPEVVRWRDLKDVDDLLARVNAISTEGKEHLARLTEAKHRIGGYGNESSSKSQPGDTVDQTSPRLDPEQEELLAQMVEAQRSLPRKQRRHFVLAETFDSSELVHSSSVNIELTKSDIDALQMRGLVYLAAISGRGSPNYDITPEGYAHYEAMRTRSGEPLAAVEDEVIKRFIDGDVFRRDHPEAWSKWSRAADKLWSEDWERELTNIGHLCRESIQTFAADLVARFDVPDAPPDRNKDIARIKAVLAHQKARLGRRDQQLLAASATYLESLLEYWRAVSGLIQRQEHGKTGEDGALIWRDARRVVFQTALVMYEVEASLVR